MLPKFPTFSPLVIAHKDAVIAISSKFEPYSDFDFTSLFCWNSDDSTEISNLSGNLVVRIPDYMTGKPVYSLLGTNVVDEALLKLFEITPTLKLVPEVVVRAITKKSQFLISEDRDHFDYIYSVETHAKLHGQPFKGKRKQLSKFRKANGNDALVKSIDFNDTDTLDRIKHVFYKWVRQKQDHKVDTSQESTALDKILTSAEQLDVICYELVVREQSVGFAIVEIANETQATYHFQKTLVDTPGADTFLTHEVAKNLLARGCEYINWEQDLGFPGLRHNKMSWKPEKLLKKYNIQRALLQ